MAARLDKEPRKIFSFRDRYDVFEMPLELKVFIDSLRKQGGIGGMIVYVTVLAHVAGAQQEEYSEGQTTMPYTLIVSKEQDSVEASNILEEIARSHEGSRGIEGFAKQRDELIQSLGLEIVRQLESYLKVDSRGVEANDPRPLLGVDLETVKALHNYIDKETSYEEIA